MSLTYRTGRVGCLFLVNALLGGCGAKVASGPGTDTSTDWVKECEVDQECEQEELCGCGLCTRECTKDSDCVAFSPTAVCATSLDACSRAQTVCVPDTTFSWLKDPASPSSSSSPPADNDAGAALCTEFPAGVRETTPLRLTFQRVDAVKGMWGSPVLDASNLYWMDSQVQLFEMPLTEIGPLPYTSARRLREAPEPPVTPTGPLLDNQTTLFWTEADAQPPGGLPEPNLLGPPVRLYRLNKHDGVPELVFEEPDRMLQLVGVDSDHVWLVSSGDYALFTWSLAEERLTAVLPDFEATFAQMTDGQLYWFAVNADDEATRDLLVTGLDAKNPQRVATGVVGSSLVHGNHVVWQVEQLVTEPELVLDQHFVVQQLDRACPAQPLPGLGESISSYLVDDAYVYWNSYNALGSVSVGPEGEIQNNVGSGDIVRVQLGTGEIENIVTPGFRGVPAVDHLVAQNEQFLFVQGAELIAIDKPQGNPVPECVWGVDNLLGQVGIASTPRVACGLLSAIEAEDALQTALDCVANSAADLGAQLVLNNCIDCTMLSVSVQPGTQGDAQATAAPLQLTMNNVYGKHTVRVEQCDAFEMQEGAITCVAPMELYACSEED